MASFIPKPERRKRTNYRWTPTLVDEQTAIVEDIANRIQRGERIPNLLWYRHDSVTRKARVRDGRPPGPATYQSPTSMPSIAKSHQRRKRDRRHRIQSAGDAAIHRLPGTNRIRVLPLEQASWEPPVRVDDDPAASFKHTSTCSSLPSWTMGFRRASSPRGDGSGPSSLASPPSCLGRQLLSTRRNAPTARLGQGPTRDAVASYSIREQLGVPGPQRYHAGNVGSVRPRAPAFSLQGRVGEEESLMQERHCAELPGPGAHDPSFSLDCLSRGSGAGATLGERARGELAGAEGAVPDQRGVQAKLQHQRRMRAFRYKQAHEREQPVPLRAPGDHRGDG